MSLRANFFILSLAVLVSACGGGSSSSNENSGSENSVITVAEGRFIDSPVSGLFYNSGDQEGTTGNRGEFIYELINGVPQPVSFSMGSLPLGSATGGDIITPYDITNSPIHEINVATLLLALDVDSNPDNGIEISDSLVNNYNNFDWSSVDLTAADILTSDSLNVFVSDVFSVTQTFPDFQDVADVESHLSETHRCIAAGNYFGEYTGDENGPVVIGVDPETGSMSGIGWSRNRNTGFGFPFGQQVLSRLTRNEFSIIANDLLVFTGAINNYSEMTGIWSSDQLGSGNFSLLKINYPEFGRYHFTGTYLANIPGAGNIPIGAFSFSVRDDNMVEGEMVNIIIGTSELTPLSGTVEGSELALQSTHGMSFEGFIDLDANTYTGSWTGTTGFINSGTFTANGCLMPYD